ncbi:MAG: hypothetical protein D4R84_04765, partial [Rhodocyclaceae bacterium]
DTVYRGGSGSDGVGATQPTGVGGAGGGGAGSTGAGGDANPSATTAGTGTANGGGAGAAGRTTSGACTTGATIAGGGGCGGYALSGTNRNGGSGARGRIDMTYVPATVLADGTNPSNVTLAPGAGITDLDAFTLVTSTTTDSVTALTVTLTGVNSSDALSEVRITNSAGSTPYFTAVTNPGSNTINFSGGTPITATTTVTTYKVRITPKTHANMPLPPGLSYAVGGTVTAFTSSRAQTLGDSGSATVTIDNLSPASATATSGTAGDASVTLNWTTSSSSDFSRSVMLRWTGGSVGFEVPAEGTDYTNGNTIGTATVACVRTADAASTVVSGVDGAGTGSCSATPLTNGQAYSYRIFQKDSNGNHDTGTTVGTFTPYAIVATKLAFFQQPSTTGAGVAISPAVTVQVQDASGTLVTASTASITIAIGTNPASGTLSGTFTQNAVAGVATFSDLSINNAGTGYTLTANSSGLTGATSVSFDITATLCFTDDFNRANGSPGANWSVGNKSGAFGNPVIVSNRLRLTDATGAVATWATLQRLIPAAGNMVTVVLDYYAYGGTHADGVAVILSDASVAPAAGAFGGSLGYAQKGYTPVSDCTTPGGCPGFTGGWLGVALDEYGNYSTNTEGRYGGSATLIANSVAVRGSGTGQSGYRFLQGTGTLSPAVDAVAAPPHRYRVVVDHTDGVHAYVSVERDATSGGTAYTTLIGCPPGVTSGCTVLDVKDPGYSQNPIPTSFNLSFTVSTGGSNNIHEIDNLSVCTVQALAPPALHHIRIEHGGTACTSNPATVTVKACADANCTSLYLNSVTVNLTPDAGGGRTWTPVEPLTFSGGSTTLTLANTAAGAVTLGGSATSPTTSNATRCFNGATETCTLTYAVCTFDVIQVAAAANTPIFTKLAGYSFNLDVLSLSGAAQTANAVALVDASSGACAAYPVLANTSTAVPSSFTANQRKTFSFSYANAAPNVRVRVTDATAAVSCSSDNFAIRPLSLTVTSSATQTGSSGTPVFMAGTDSFSVTATAATNLYTGTPKVNGALVTSGQANPGILTAPTLLAATAGVSTTTGFKWSEVGNINFAQIAVYDDSYANVDSIKGECTSEITNTNGNPVGTADANGKFGCMFYSAAAGPFGRFIPTYLKTEFDTAQPCTTFTYSGQPFRIKVTAMSATGTTLNYTGSFAKGVDLGGDGASVCTPTTTGFSNVTPSPSLAAAGFTAGVASTPVITSPSPLPVSYAQALAAPATVNVCAKDADAVNSHGHPQAALTIRNGRLRLSNAFGSEKANLAMPVEVQYWTGLSWVLGSDDSCTGAILTSAAGTNAVALSGYVAPLSAANTGASHVSGFTANGSGKWLLTLTKPSPVATGSVSVAINLGNSGVDQSCLASHGGTGASIPWLRSLNGNCAVTYDRDPSARATFGVYSPESRKTVHVRESF